MKSYLSIFGAAVFALALLSSCENKAVDGGEDIKQTALLYNIDEGNTSPATAYRANAIGLTEGDGIATVERNFALGLVRPADDDVQVSVRFDKVEAENYLRANAQDMEILPEALVKLPDHLSIDKGAMMSETAKLTVEISDQIKIGQAYIFAISLDKVIQDKDDCLRLSDINRSLVYTLKRVPQGQIEITKVLQLDRENCLKFASNTFDHHYNNYTIETLVYVDKFRTDADPGEAKISTLFGIEGGMLFRFGDAGLPGNVLQAYGQRIPYEFQTKRWYHVAIVFEGASSMTVYVDGNQVARITGKVATMQDSKPFYVGKSWSEQRGIAAKLSEMRIWDVARSADDLKEGMYGVDPSTPGLLGYWKMDAVDGARIRNLAKQQGVDLIHVTQAGERETKANVITLDNPIEIED